MRAPRRPITRRRMRALVTGVALAWPALPGAKAYGVTVTSASSGDPGALGVVPARAADDIRALGEPHDIFTGRSPTLTATSASAAPAPRFELNRGQADPDVRFLVRAPGGTLFLRSDAAVLAGAGSALYLVLEGANPAAAAHGLDPLPGATSYLRGRDPSKWLRDVPAFARVRIRDAWPGIDVIYRMSTGGGIESDFVVAPGADPTRIRLGAGDAMTVTGPDGTLDLSAGSLRLRLGRPIAWQDREGRRVPVQARYQRSASGSIGLRLGRYDRGLPLTIDPPLDYASFLGGSGRERASAIAVDGSGAAYVVGTTHSIDFPIRGGPGPALQGASDAFVTKVAASGATLVYSTYFGGSDEDEALGVAIDGGGNAWVVGSTRSSDLPVAGAIQPVFGGGTSDAFVMALDASGSTLRFASYFGGSELDEARGVALDAAGRPTFVGLSQSSDLPTLRPIQALPGGSTDAFVARLGSGGAGLDFATYLGGGGDDWGNRVALDAAGAALVVGMTRSLDFPTRAPLQAVSGGAWDAFVLKLTTSGDALDYSTYLGGTGNDYGWGIASDATGSAYLVGETESRDFPLASALQPRLNGVMNAFVTRLLPDASGLVFSTYFGGSSVEYGRGIAVDGCGAIHFTGVTGSADFPTRDAFQPALHGRVDAYVVKLAPSGSAVECASYLGGAVGDYEASNDIAVDSTGRACLAGETPARDFPAIGGFQIVFGGAEYDAFVARVDCPSTPSATPVSVPIEPCLGATVRLDVASAAGCPGGYEHQWREGARVVCPWSALGSCSILPALGATTYTLETRCAGSIGCSGESDTIVTVAAPPIAVAGLDVEVCRDASLILDASASTVPSCPAGARFEWRSGVTVVQPASANPSYAPPTASLGTTTYTVVVDCPTHPGCPARDDVEVRIKDCPLAVRFGALRAHRLARDPASDEVEWDTLSEDNTLGFSVERCNGPSGPCATTAIALEARGAGSRYVARVSSPDRADFYRVVERTGAGAGDASRIFAVDTPGSAGRERSPRTRRPR